MIADPKKPGIFVAPLVVPRSAPQRQVEDRYRVIPSFELQQESPETPENAQSELQATINNLQDRVTVLETMINGASIAAVCNMDGTITVTLTWGE